MFDWFQPHWTSYGESRISSFIQNAADFSVFRIGQIAAFPLDSIMPFMYLDVGG